MIGNGRKAPFTERRKTNSYGISCNMISILNAATSSPTTARTSVISLTSQFLGQFTVMQVPKGHILG